MHQPILLPLNPQELALFHSELVLIHFNTDESESNEKATAKQNINLVVYRLVL